MEQRRAWRQRKKDDRFRRAWWYNALDLAVRLAIKAYTTKMASNRQHQERRAIAM